MFTYLLTYVKHYTAVSHESVSLLMQTGICSLQMANVDVCTALSSGGG